MAFIASKMKLGTDYTYLGTGDLRSILLNSEIKNKWNMTTGIVPDGNYLVDALWDHLTLKSDPQRITAPKPIIPTVKLEMNLRLPGHSIVKTEIFKWGDSYTEKIKAVIQADLNAVRDQSQSGQIVSPKTKEPDTKFHRKVAQGYCEKYKVSWEKIKPKDWLVSETPLPKETILADDFDTSDSDTLGHLLSWWEPSENFKNYDNKCYPTYSGYPAFTWPTASLSSDDMYIQSDWSGGAIEAVCGRLAYGDFAFGYCGASVGTWYVYIYKYDGTYYSTELISATEYHEFAYPIKLIIDGSDLILLFDSVESLNVTDTSITGNLKPGYHDLCYTGINDNFEAGDLGVPPPSAPFTKRRVVVTTP